MQIVVLDGYTLNPGDLSWKDLDALGPCTIHDRTPEDLVVSRARDAGIVLTNKTILSASVIEALPQLRYIAVLATGYNVVDVGAARQRGIPVSNVPTYGTDSVAQMVLAHLLNLTQHVAEHAKSAGAGRWSANPDFCYWDYPLAELCGLTLGIVGFGRIGQATARLARAFGMKVIYHDIRQDVSAAEARAVDLDTLFGESDVVSLHCPLTEANRELVNERRLNLMKRCAFLINTSRGPLVDERALAEALNSGRIAGAGLDVLSEEPPAADHPLLGAKNCYVTPHIAWATRAARARLLQTTVENVAAFLNGTPQNVVNDVTGDTQP
ncbi:MAG: D-2-hydroxyacid dehydrogenase [Sedimentisphaerales bacterium]|nr:D-2-hydroxyacid dehydrogenase [Sedimentisphaerales bacterium]